MTKQWHFREYRDGDEKDILGLYKLVFGTEIYDEHWQWKYKRNTAGSSLIVIAETEQEIVGQYALLPRLIKIRDEVYSAGLSVDTMVHPGYQGQGIFVTMAKETYNLAARKKIQFVYGFPNGNSYHGFITKLGWVDLYKGIPLWVKPLDLKNILKKCFVDNRLLISFGNRIGNITLRIFYRSPKGKPGCSIREISSFDSRFDSFWDKASGSYNKIMLVRDKTFLNWRYVEKPASGYVILIAEKKGDLLGYIVLRCMEEFGLQIGFIVDILTIDNEAGVCVDLITAAEEYFRQKKMDIISFLMLPVNHYYAHILKQTGFIKAPNRLLPQNMFLGIRNINYSQADDFLTKPSNWFITWGDHDVI